MLCELTRFALQSIRRYLGAGAGSTHFIQQRQRRLPGSKHNEDQRSASPLPLLLHLNSSANHTHPSQKLPLPRDTQCSMGKDIRSHPRAPERHHSQLFKMSKFKAVGATLCTQPNAHSSRKCEDDADSQPAGDDYVHDDD
ncbi:unnamed protein product [Phytophthora lilii]|uniref:Unnamed protein product n=1 Tax=Phytophthora lilii TaxID=2077276 RepID=A0A9W6XFB5_9STRA|nr:unnamed protein product [Phytophthora lilii]